MSFRPPFIPPESLADFITRHFPLSYVETESIKQFDGYDDRNYYFAGTMKKDLVIAVEGRCFDQFVIKFINSRDSKNLDVLEGLSKLACFLFERGFNCPYPIHAVSSCRDTLGSGVAVLNHSDLLCYATENNLDTNGNGVGLAASSGHGKERANPDHQFCVRLTVFVDGELFGHGEHSPDLLFELGQYVGKMNKEMMKFSHPGIKNRTLDEWDLKRLLTKREVIPIAISDQEQAAILYNILDDFEQYIVPMIDKIPYIKRGYIHSDINGLNIVLKRDSNTDKLHVSGLIDYSNAVYAPLLFELGISMAYLMLRRNDEPATYVKPFLDGYLSEISLSDHELTGLYYVVLGRLVQSFLNGMYTHKFEPTNKYVLVEALPGWELIKLLLKEGKLKCHTVWNIPV